MELANVHLSPFSSLSHWLRLQPGQANSDAQKPPVRPVHPENKQWRPALGSLWGQACAPLPFGASLVHTLQQCLHGRGREREACLPGGGVL